MDVQAYERHGRARFERLAVIVVGILQAALRQQGGLRPQQLQHRAKDPDSLARKLAKAGALEDAQIEAFAKDLAGVRLVFYTNSDVSQFLNSGIIRDHFEVDWDRTKIHHPTAADAGATELFVSNNYVVRLKDDRLALPDFAEFADMWCEVQVQTTLNHAWAEMAHDTIYKRPDLTGFGAGLMEGIEARMKDIMQRFLAPAGYAFDKVALDFARLAQGQELFEAGFARSIESSQTNNELHEAIAKYSGSVLPYLNDHEAIAAEITDATVSAIGRARTLPTQPVETPFGNLKGKSSLDVATAGAQLLGELRFLNPEHNFSIYCDLYQSAESDEERKIWMAAAAQLAEHHIGVWEQAGPTVQGIVMTFVMRMGPDQRQALMPLILAVLPKIFATDMSGSKSNGADAIIIQQGAVAPSEMLRAMRKDAIRLVDEFYASAEDDEDRKKILQVYSSAMAMPTHRGARSPDLAAIVFDDAAEIITGYREKSDDWSFERLQNVEDRLHWKYRHYGKAPPPELTNPNADAARERMVQAILAFRDKVNADEGFTTYKVLVGFESIFPPAWEDPQGFDYTAEEAYRSERISELIAEISPANAQKWQAIIERCAATESNDLATFPPFTKFLEGLAAQKPEIALDYLRSAGVGLMKFTAAVLRGLSTTNYWDQAIALQAAWLERGEHLATLAWASGLVDAIRIQFLADVTTKAIESQDTDAVFSALGSMARRDTDDAAALLKPVFLNAVNHMHTHGEPGWVNGWLSLSKKSPLLDTLTAEEVRNVLQTLVAYTEVGSRLESFLRAVAHTNPDAVVDYLGSRVRHATREARSEGYDALPYEFHGLEKALQSQATKVVQVARSLFQEQPDLFEYRGGRLVELAFPKFSEELERELLAAIATGNRDDVSFVVGVLRSFTGEAFLHPVAKAAVAALPEDDELLTGIEIALEQMGVVSGSFGRVNALKKRRDVIAQWLEDDREPVRRYAQRHIHHLEQNIRSEQRRSEERTALRQLEYDQVVAEQIVNDDDEEPDEGEE